MFAILAEKLLPFLDVADVAADYFRIYFGLVRHNFAAAIDTFLPLLCRDYEADGDFLFERSLFISIKENNFLFIQKLRRLF